MTPAEADARIIKSRQTLAVYIRMVAAGMKLDADLGMMDAELGVLVDISHAHPGEAEKIAALVEQWRDLMEKVRTVH
jgi:hypothetical protein